MTFGALFRFLSVLLIVIVGISQPASLAAQSRFSPAIEVGDSLVTRYQLDQRILFLSLLRAPGDPRQLAEEQLINEAIQLQAARTADISPSEEEIRAGQTEFAARANLSADEFIAALGQNGVGAETFRDFVKAGVAWRNYVRDRFTDDARDFTPSQINRTISQTGTEGGVRVLLSEILLPAETPETAAASRVRAQELLGLDEDAFAAAARRYSVAASAAVGGAQGWLAVDSLPPTVAAAVAPLQPGQTSRIVEDGEVIALYHLRNREVVAPGAPDNLSVDYALFLVGGGPSEASRVAQSIDTCDDLYGVAQGLPEERLIRETLPVNALPADIQSAVATMDAGETNISLQRGGTATVLMLCERRPALISDVDINIIGNRLLNARLGALAAKHLADLRAATFINVIAR